MAERIVEINNCLSEGLTGRKVSPKASDRSPEGDNNFHCPVTGIWTELKTKGDKFECQSPDCGLRFSDVL